MTRKKVLSIDGTMKSAIEKLAAVLQDNLTGEELIELIEEMQEKECDSEFDEKLLTHSLYVTNNNIDEYDIKQLINMQNIIDIVSKNIDKRIEELK